jgi:aldehyde dehydrogenase (NAD+)
MAAHTDVRTTETSNAQATPATLDAPALVASLRREFARERTRSYAWRVAQLDGIKRMLVERKDELLDALSKDLGKPSLEGFGTEIAYNLGCLAETKKHLKAWMKPEKVSTPIFCQPGKSYIHKDPLGVVLIISPWNYPFGLAIGPLMGAVAAGNCAVVKPSEVAPETSSFIARRLPQYVDADCIKVVEGGVPETTALLEQHWDHIFYTGNGAVGRIVMAAAAKHLTPVTLELGGKSPCYIDRSTDLDVTAKRVAWGKWSNAGQTCVAPDYVLAHRDVHDAFLDKIVATVREFYGDDPQRSRDYGRVVNQRHHARLMKLLDSGDVVCGGGADASDRYLAPTVLRDVPPDSPVMKEEIFGPILPVLCVDNHEAAIRFINERDKPLALYVFTSDAAVAEEFIERTSAGGMSVNHTWMHLGNHALPFGGVGESGMGAYHGKHSFDTFSHHKSVLKKPFALDAPVMYPPFTPTKEAILKRVL